MEIQKEKEIKNDTTCKRTAKTGKVTKKYLSPEHS